MRASVFWALANGITLTALTCSLLIQTQDEQIRDNFEHDASKITADIQARMKAHFDALLSVKGMFAFNNTVDRAMYKQFVAKLDLRHRYPELQVVQFIRFVKPAERESFVASVRQDTSVNPQGYPHFKIHPEGERKQYFVIEYSEPMLDHEVGFGFDLGSLPPHLKAIELSRDIDAIVTTEKIKLMQHGSGHTGFAVRAPLYRQNLPIDTIEQRRAALLGFASLVFLIDNFMQEVVDQHLLAHMAIQINDLGYLNDSKLANTGNLLFDSNQSNNGAAIPKSKSLNTQTHIDVGQRRWQLRFVAKEGTRYGRNYFPLIIIGIVGSISTGLAVTLTIALGRRRALARDLKLALEEQRAFQDNAVVGIGLISHGVVSRCNRGLEEMLGYGPDELLGKSPAVLHSSGRAYRRFACSAYGAIKAGRRAVGELDLIKKDGTRICCIYHGKAVDMENLDKGVIWVIHDISQRKRIEAELKQTLLEQQAIFDNANAGIVMIKDQVIQRCNHSFEQMLGYEDGELSGKSTRICYPNQDSWISHGLVWGASDCHPKAQNQGIEWQYTRKDGSLIWCRTHGKLINPHDASKGFIGVSIDITSRKLTEATLVEAKNGLKRSLDEAAKQRENVETAHRNISLLSEIGREITSTLDREAIMVSVCSHVHQLMDADIVGIGIVREDQRLIEFPFNMTQGRRTPPYARSIDDPNQLAVWCFKHAEGVFINDIETEYAQYIEACGLDKVSLPELDDGPDAAKPLSMIYAPMISKNRVMGTISAQSVHKNAYQRVHLDMLLNLAGYVAVALDNADAYRQLQSAQQQLVFQEKMASLGTLTAGIAHEINNPANFAHVGAHTLNLSLERFRAFLMELAGEEADAELIASLNARIDQLATQIETIIEGTTRIRNLVLDLRTFSRLDQAVKKEVLIADSLLSTVNLVRTQYLEVTEIRCDLTANPLLDCFPAELNQVFMNLIVNACQAIESRQRESEDKSRGLLSIRSRIEGPGLFIEFEDNGKGIPEDTINRIFEPFFTTKTVGEGMGMGLSISFGIVSKHKGKLTVSSVEGVGTCFTLMLPLAQPETLEQED